MFKDIPNLTVSSDKFTFLLIFFFPIFLISGNLLVAGALFIVAEGLGIVEELV